MSPLQFQPLSSQPTPSFWSSLTSHKLDNLKLDDKPIPVNGYYQLAKSVSTKDTTDSGDQRPETVGINGSVVVGEYAFNDEDKLPPHTIPVAGTLKLFNTIEEFKNTAAKKSLFDDLADTILKSFDTDEPILNTFLVVAFADLKKYIYHYWFAFPALASAPAWEIEDAFSSVSSDELSPIRKLALENLCHAFALKNTACGPVAVPLNSLSAVSPEETLTVVFHDPSSLPANPGWPLRNVLFYLNHKYHIHRVNLICLRETSAVKGIVIVGRAVEGLGKNLVPKAVGWERNQGKLVGRVVDLGPMLDPSRLAAQAVDLNLKLIKWRILPSISLEYISSTKCLLLGAGTLGCYVSRMLLGWGVRNITFVDSGRVSYSNPVRQPLFDFEDCLNGGKPKAQCAAERLKKIFPGVNSRGVSLSIPMPGHPTSKATQDISTLTSLILSHDAVFLLMDSRESRWLPTVIAKEAGKIVINAALGFDSWLVMRHGAKDEGGKESLGCYYCNDIVAPTDSLTDRTLDQMCTVTRPGVAPIAAAMAVELLVSITQHSLGHRAPASINPDDAHGHSDNEAHASILGIVPHQLRGNLHGWQNHLVTGRAYDRCTGCSETVLNAYRTRGQEFLMKVFNEFDYLEKLTGLDELHRESEEVLKMMEKIDMEGSDSGEDF